MRIAVMWMARAFDSDCARSHWRHHHQGCGGAGLAVVSWFIIRGLMCARQANIAIYQRLFEMQSQQVATLDAEFAQRFAPVQQANEVMRVVTRCEAN